MSVTQTSTALGTFGSSTTGSTVALPSNGGRSAPVILCVTTGATSGASLSVQGRNKKTIGDVASSFRELFVIPAVANGSRAYPLAKYLEGGLLPDELQVVSTWTDGSHVVSALTHA